MASDPLFLEPSASAWNGVMCGIAGQISAKGPPDQEWMARIRTGLLHRGPDAQTCYVGPAIGLVHTRLAIVDLEGGTQPFYSADGAVVAIVNGEIYNHQRLRKEHLADRPPASASDCGVIVPLYEKYGLDFVSLLEGMFAIALYDARRNVCHLIRDRMGEKPIVCRRTDRGLFFASELSALVESLGERPTLDRQAIGDYFRYQYVPEPCTPFEGYWKVEPGAIASIDCRTCAVETRSYWRFADALTATDHGPCDTLDPDSASAAIAERLVDGVRGCLQADRPIALSLSSGVDSSAIAAIAADVGRKDLQVITVGYGQDDPFDESEEAEDFAHQLGLTTHKLTLNDPDGISRFADVVRAKDEPIADPSGFSYYSVMAFARERGFPVLLQGHGSDELLWGYPWAREALLGRDLAPSAAFSNPEELYRFLPYLAWLNQQKARVFDADFLSESARGRPASLSLSEQRLDLKVTEIQSMYYLQSVGIAQGDRLGMAHSVELRLPFVNHTFVETILRTRAVRPDHEYGEKALLKAALRPWLDESMLNRPKRGFGSPVNRWFEGIRLDQGGLLRGGVLESIGILTPEATIEMSETPNRGPGPLTLFRMAITLEIWLRRFYPV